VRLPLARGKAIIIRVRLCMLDQNPCSALSTSTSPATLHQACLGTFSGLLLPSGGFDRPQIALRLLLHHQPPHPSLPLPRSTNTGTPSKQASKRRITAMIYSLIKRIPGSQGTKVCVGLLLVLGNETWMGACVASCG